MSEMAPEQDAPRRGAGGALRRKIGPLPVWMWALIVAALILGYVWFKASKSQQSGPSDTAGAGQVPQFVNQSFISPSPPGPPDEDEDDDDDKKPPHSHPIGHPPPPHNPPPRRHHPKPPPGHGEPPPGHGGPPPRHRRHHHRAHPPHVVHGGGRP